MPILQLNMRQKGAIMVILAKREGKSAAQLVRRIRELFDWETVEEIEETNAEKLQPLVTAGRLAPGANIPEDLAREHDIVVWRWKDRPEKIEIDKLLLEQLRGAFKAEVDKEGSGGIKGADWRLLDVAEELDRAWEEAKEASRELAKVGKRLKGV